MRLSRSDLFPLLAIIAGGAIGFSLSVGFVALSRSGVEPETDAPARVGTVAGQVVDAETGGPVAPPAMMASAGSRSEGWDA